MKKLILPICMVLVSSVLAGVEYGSLKDNTQSIILEEGRLSP
jgi:hypothetical protein